MGLKKMVQGGLTSYLYSDGLNQADQIKVIILSKNESFSLKKTPREYLCLLSKAVTTSFTTTDKEDIFEIQEDHFVWKQYFPDLKVYGKRGKFKLETIEYDDAVGKVLDGAIQELKSDSQCIQTLKEESQKMSNKVNEAVDMASRSVLMKEEFEREIYSKCAAIINAKKLRIQQLKSSHPTSSVGKPCGLVRSAETSGSAARPPKKARLENSDSDCYDSDTDVDEPDEDTDEENLARLSPSKQRHEANFSAEAKAPAVVSDSQECFNDSLEAELYPTATTSKRPNFSSKSSVVSKNDTKGSQRGKTNKCGTSSVASHTSKQSRVPEDNNQKSIIDELF
ncbi:hypothetical protein Hamer_G023971 [Homarus americanus]|uniref:XRCC4 n=1 Tax=Homarus americanus TaxID=6706 RepID=A0A8J5MSF1_HOMAM|nr:hypothetical protein Hamer_G023971 [Homarus americanus]